MTWKDQYREEKKASGLTWDEYHERRFVHVDELDGASQTLEELDEHVQALTNEYQQLRRQLGEIMMLLESGEFET